MLSALRQATRQVRPTMARSTVLKTSVRGVGSSVQPYNKEEVQSQINRLHDSFLSANWGDYLCLVQNMPFWEQELERLEHAVVPFLADKDIGPKWQYILEGFDCCYACEDTRDHINELLELKTRSTGVMGMGVGAGEGIANIDEQVTMLGNQYEWLLKEYPTFKPKVEQSVGHGLGIMRMKHKFDFKHKHLFFF